ncbi:MAG: hypothetical protein PVH19_14735, partial [Planctomycetia bacterium]
LVGTETSRVEAVMVKGDPQDDLGELAMQVCDKIAQRVSDQGAKLTGEDLITTDPLPGLVATAKKLAAKPTVAIVVTEEHISGPRPVVILDPAVETELKKILIQAGFTIKDVKQNELANWAPTDAWPQTLDGVDMVLTGEALSEFASRIGSLVNCSARAEINLIDRKQGKVVLADRVTARATDLSENVAGKKALQAAGRKLGINVLKHVTKTTQSVKQ